MLKKTVFFLITLLLACNNFYEYGSVELFFTDEVRTVQPNISLDIYEYEIIGDGPGSAAFTETILYGSSYTLDYLATGVWSFTVNAKNSTGTVLGSGSTQVSILSGYTAITSVSILPLEGSGTLDLTLHWGSGALSSPNVIATLTSTQGETVNIDFLISGNSGIYTGIFDNNYYTLSIELFDGLEKVWGKVDAILIYSDTTSEMTYNTGL